MNGMLGPAWALVAGLSPDGTEAAYTTYVDHDTIMQPRVFTYDLKTGRASLLVDKMRTRVVFVKDGWVWYLEERACTSNCAGSTEPTGKVFAMQLSAGVELPVTFGSGEDPIAQGGNSSAYGFTPGDFWPST